MKKGFTIMELVIVLVVLGILGTLLYNKMGEVTEDSLAQVIVKKMSESEVAYAKVLATVGSIRPAAIEDNQGTIGSPTERCFNWDGTESYVTSIDRTTTTSADKYAALFSQGLKDELLSMGFKERSDGSLYIAKFPRSVFNVCHNNGTRYFTLEKIKGSIALKALSAINNGQAPTGADGSSGDKKAALWKSTETKNPGASIVITSIMNMFNNNPVALSVPGSDTSITQSSSANSSTDSSSEREASQYYINDTTTADSIDKKAEVSLSYTISTKSSGSW